MNEMPRLQALAPKSRGNAHLSTPANQLSICQILHISKILIRYNHGINLIITHYLGMVVVQAIRQNEGSMREILLPAAALPERSGRGYQSLDDFIGISHCDTLQALSNELIAFTRQMGFHSFVYLANFLDANAMPTQLVFSNYPEDWIKQYRECRYADIDPILEHCLRREPASPLAWSTAQFSRAPQRALWQQANRYGLDSGLCIPLSGSASNRGLLGLSGPLARQAGNSLEVISRLYLLSGFLRIALWRLAVEPSESTPRPLLTTRERQCLSRLAAGHQPKRIASQLDLAERTVRMHLYRARHRLGARSIEAAVALGMHYGLIQL